MVLPKASDATPTNSITSNKITDIYASKDTVWVATENGVCYTWDTGKSWKGYTNEGYLGKGNVLTIINKYGKTFASTCTNPTSDTKGTGISEYKDENWENKDFSWKYDLSLYKAGFDVCAFDSVFYFAYGIGALLKYDMRTNKSWEIVVPDTFGVTNNYDFGEFPPDTFVYKPDNDSVVKQPAYPNEFAILSVAIDSISVDSCHIYLGTLNGIMFSVNKGKTWKHKVSNKNIGRSINRLWLQKKSDQTILWALTSDNGDTVTNDSGTIIDQKNEIVQIFNNGNIWNIYDNINPHRLTDLDFDGENVWAVTLDGLYKIKDNEIISEPDFFYQRGLVPKKCYSIEIINNLDSTELWIGTKEGIFYSDNQGKDWKEIRLNKHVNKGLSQVYAVPNIMKFGQEPVRIVYNLSKNAKTTIEIYDWNMNLVKTIIKNKEREAGTNIVGGRSTKSIEDKWDGTNVRGFKVPIGVYYIKVESDQGEKGFGKIIVVH